MKEMTARSHRGTEVLMIYAILIYLPFIFGCDGSLQGNYVHFDAGSVNKLVPQANKIIEESLNDNDPQIRTTAIEVVATTKQVQFMPKVERLLQDGYVPVRFIAAIAVGDTGYSFGEGSVRYLLRDKDENVRIAADYAISRLSPNSRFELVREAIMSKDQKVRANAAFLLGKSGDTNSLKLLWYALRDESSDYKVRFNAAEAIARLGDERIEEKLLAMLISAYADDRMMGIKAMGALGTHKAKDFLITKLDDDVLEIRLAAAEQLGLLGDTSGEPEVLEVFTVNFAEGFNSEDIERIKVMTALAIGQIGTPSLTRYLPQFLKDKSKYVRIAGAKAVFQCAKKG